MVRRLRDRHHRIVLREAEQQDRQSRVTVLATYNAEVYRGLVHTEEWREKMRAEQAWFDAGCPS